jgi:hypothetical protein
MGKHATFVTNYLDPIGTEANRIYDRLGDDGPIEKDDVRLLAEGMKRCRVVLIGLARELDELKAQIDTPSKKDTIST